MSQLEIDCFFFGGGGFYVMLYARRMWVEELEGGLYS